MKHVVGTVPGRTARSEGGRRRPVDPQGPEAAAEDQQAGDIGIDREPAPRFAAIGAGDRRRHRAAGDEVAARVASGDRKGEADAPGPRREQAVGESEVAVGLGEDERQPHAGSRYPGRRSDVAAAAHHRIGTAGPEEPAGAADAGRRLRQRPRRPQWVAPIES